MSESRRSFVDESRFDIWKTVGPFYGGESTSYDVANRALLTPISNRSYIPIEVSELLYCATNAESHHMWGGVVPSHKDVLWSYVRLHEQNQPNDVFVAWPIGFRTVQKKQCVAWIVGVVNESTCVWRTTVLSDWLTETHDATQSLIELIQHCEDAFGETHNAKRMTCASTSLWSSLVATCVRIAATHSSDDDVVVLDNNSACETYVGAIVDSLEREPGEYLKYGCAQTQQNAQSWIPKRLVKNTLAFLTTRVPHSLAPISYRSWDAPTTYAGFSPHLETLEPDFDFFANVIVEKSDWWTNECIACRVRDTNTVDGGWRAFRVSNTMYPPVYITDPWLRFAFAACECSDLPHQKHLERDTDGVHPARPSGLYGSERGILMRTIERLCEARTSMAPARAVDALKHATLTVEQQHEIALKCINIQLVDGVAAPFSDDRVVVRYTQRKDGRFQRANHDEESYGSLIEMAIAYSRRKLFHALDQCASQPLLVGTRLVQMAGLCPLKRMRTELFVFSLDSEERATLLNGMFEAFRRGDRNDMHSFCVEHAIQLALLFRTAKLDTMRHLAFLKRSLESFRTTLEMTNIFHQMSFSFDYSTDCILWKRPSTLRVTWVRDRYIIDIVCHPDCAHIDVRMDTDSYYTASDYGEYVRSTEDVLTLTMQLEDGTTTIGSEPRSVFDLDTGEAPSAPFLRATPAGVECVGIDIQVRDGGSTARINLTKFQNTIERLKLSLCASKTEERVLGYIAV